MINKYSNLFVLFTTFLFILINLKFVLTIYPTILDGYDFVYVLENQIVSSGCDVNNDGYEDLISNGDNSAYVYFGSSKLKYPNSKLAIPEGLNGENGFSIKLDNAESFRLYPVCGDLNNDGFDDLAFTIQETGFTGTVLVIYGSNTTYPATITKEQLDGEIGFILTGSDDSNSTYSKTIGDFNNDSKKDLIFAFGGNIYTLFGISNGKYSTTDGYYDISQIISGNNGFIIEATVTGQIESGDLNSDGAMDLVYQNSVNNEFIVVFGKSTFSSPYELTYENSITFTKDGATIPRNLNTKIFGFGDINGDQIQDLVINIQLNYGIVFVIFGSVDVESQNLDTPNPNSFISLRKYNNEEDNVLCSNILVDDVNGDGIDDIQCTDNSATTFGLFWTVFGSILPFPSESFVYEDSLLIDQCKGFSFNSYSTGTAIIDVNGDGLKDLLISQGVNNYVFYLNAYIRDRLNPKKDIRYEKSNNGFLFLKNNIKPSYGDCPSTFVTIKIDSPDSSDQLIFENPDETKFIVQQISNTEIKFINNGLDRSFISILSENVSYKTDRNTNALILIQYQGGDLDKITINHRPNPTTPSESKPSKSRNIGVIIGPVLAGFAVLCAIIGFIIYKRKSKSISKNIPMD